MESHQAGLVAMAAQSDGASITTLPLDEVVLVIGALVSNGWTWVALISAAAALVGTLIGAAASASRRCHNIQSFSIGLTWWGKHTHVRLHLYPSSSSSSSSSSSELSSSCTLATSLPSPPSDSDCCIFRGNSIDSDSIFAADVPPSLPELRQSLTISSTLEPSRASPVVVSAEMADTSFPSVTSSPTSCFSSTSSFLSTSSPLLRTSSLLTASFPSRASVPSMSSFPLMPSFPSWVLPLLPPPAVVTPWLETPSPPPTLEAQLGLDKLIPLRLGQQWRQHHRQRNHSFSSSVANVKVNVNVNATTAEITQSWSNPERQLLKTLQILESRASVLAMSVPNATACSAVVSESGFLVWDLNKVVRVGQVPSTVTTSLLHMEDGWNAVVCHGDSDGSVSWWDLRQGYGCPVGAWSPSTRRQGSAAMGLTPVGYALGIRDEYNLTVVDSRMMPGLNPLHLSSLNSLADVVTSRWVGGVVGGGDPLTNQGLLRVFLPNDDPSDDECGECCTCCCDVDSGKDYQVMRNESPTLISKCVGIVRSLSFNSVQSP